MADREAWPELPLPPWRDTCDKLHMCAQIAGKIRLKLAYPEPEWAHSTLYVTTRGLTTSAIPYHGRTFALDFDLIDHAVLVRSSDGGARDVPLTGLTVSQIYRQLMDALAALGISVRIWAMPVEVANPIEFTDDIRSAYDPEAVARFFRVLIQADDALKEHRAPFRRRHTLVQFFWGTFDLAYARFSGRPATPPNDDVIMKNAMDAEEICAGFWPGDDRYPQPAFWCYAFPKPPGIENVDVHLAGAQWDDAMGEFMLPYDVVRKSDDPRGMLEEFFSRTFEASAALAKWNAAS